jgi:hypothetical protein
MASAPSQSLADYMYAYFSSMVAGAGPVLLGTQNVNVTNGLATVQQVDDIFAYSGDVNAPGAAINIVTLAIPGPGTYDVTATTNLSGTTAGTDRPNLLFQKNAEGTPFTIVSSMGGLPDTNTRRMVFAGAGTVKINTNVASTAGSVYRASLLARRVA